METFNKLVRDKIIDKIKENNETPISHILTEEEYKKELNIKLNEEVKEYLESEDIEELVDIEEVILAILKTKNISKEEFEDKRKAKVLKRGAFGDKIYLEYIE
jgi:predicted house-cleaning noncanonical NTP pyrophosphatase (MazG superfamily)